MSKERHFSTPLKSMFLFTFLTGEYDLNDAFLYSREIQHDTDRFPIYNRICHLKASKISFESPLLEEGYPPTVNEYKDGKLQRKPLLIYLPGFDGTLVAPFLQFPELGTEFDLRGMTVSMEDRSSVSDLREKVVSYILEVIEEKYDEQSDSWKSGSSKQKKEMINSQKGVKITKQTNEGKERNDQVMKCSTNMNARDALSNPIMTFASKLKSVYYHATNGNSQKNTFKNIKTKSGRPVYIMGESFGGILALEVALALKNSLDERINLEGIVLINPATCYDRSKLASEGPKIAQLPHLLYPFGLLRLLPLFTDSYALPQLLLMLRGISLPSIIDTPAREAYMGRIAFSLPIKLRFMPRDTLKWRLEEWLTKGCEGISRKEEVLRTTLATLPIITIVGELDMALPSLSEAERFMDLFEDAKIHIVEGAGHACTSGTRVDLTAVIRKNFPNILKGNDTQKKEGIDLRRISMKEAAENGRGNFFGMEPRYDGCSVGLSPLLYWSKSLYRKL